MKKDSRVNHARYVELNLFPEEKENLLKDTVSSENKENHTSPDKEYDLTGLFERLSKSAFRSRFHLSKRDKEYIAEKGLETIRKHAEDFVAKRLAPAVIPNDGKQTPMRGHPVFIAQHATGLLPWMFLQMASYTCRKTADRRRTAICSSGIDGMD